MAKIKIETPKDVQCKVYGCDSGCRNQMAVRHGRRFLIERHAAVPRFGQVSGGIARMPAVIQQSPACESSCGAAYGSHRHAGIQKRTGDRDGVLILLPVPGNASRQDEHGADRRG